MALEYYDSFFRHYRAQLAEHTQRCIEDARAAFAAAAEREAARAQRTLSVKVADTSLAIVRRLAERPVGVHRVTTLLAGGSGVRSGDALRRDSAPRNKPAPDHSPSR
jgi:hypothetical protein